MPKGLETSLIFYFLYFHLTFYGPPPSQHFSREIHNSQGSNNSKSDTQWAFRVNKGCACVQNPFYWPNLANTFHIALWTAGIGTWLLESKAVLGDPGKRNGNFQVRLISPHAYRQGGTSCGIVGRKEGRYKHFKCLWIPRNQDMPIPLSLQLCSL